MTSREYLNTIRKELAEKNNCKTAKFIVITANTLNTTIIQL